MNKVRQNLAIIRHDNILWLVTAQGVAILPLLFRLPLWFSALWFCALIWRWLIHLGKLTFPSTTLKFFVSGLCLAGLFFTYRYAVGIESMVGFLVFAFVLKLLELRTHRDAFVLIFIGFVAVAAELLFSQSVLTALYATMTSLLLIAAWKTVCLTRQERIYIKLKSSAILVLQALPLMIVMFMVMPRLPPLWKGNLFNSNGQTGFSETMSPGDLSSLVQSQGTAFRVEFDEGKVPNVSDLYWRGLILEDFDGRTWRLNENWDLTGKRPFHVVTDTPPIRYSIAIEPHQYHWLFTLSEPINLDTGKLRSELTYQGLAATQRPLTSRLQYHVDSVAKKDVYWHFLSNASRKKLTQLPAGYNPKSVALGKRWEQERRQSKATQQDVIDKALALYRQSFHYTLQPPALGKDSVDEFIFDSQRGFCEHFASSFTVLMRAAGIPARVVVGYQGGTLNPEQNYWIVRQANAHAWAEVYLEGKGWRRIDPTSAVAPQRVEQGIENTFSGMERQSLAAGIFASPDWVTSLRYQLDAMNYQWDRWILSYNQDKQKHLFEQLFGHSKKWWIGLVFIALFVSFLALIALLTLRVNRPPKSELERALVKFDKRCEKWGIQRYNNETISSFSQRLAIKQPELTSACRHLATISSEVLYAAEEGASDSIKRQQATLIRLLKNFPK